MVDGSIDYLRKDLEPLSNVVASFGTYFVTGNHEYYSGAERWLDETDRMGFTNLVNENKLIKINDESIALAGVNDYRAHQIIPSHRTNPQKAIKGINNDKVKILLAHQPQAFSKPMKLDTIFKFLAIRMEGNFFGHLPTQQKKPILIYQDCMTTMALNIC